jgi:hypothetical protein
VKSRIRGIAEELGAHCKARQAKQPGVAIAQMYNALEKLRSGAILTLQDEDERIRNDGLVLIVREQHDLLDALVFEGCGWSRERFL